MFALGSTSRLSLSRRFTTSIRALQKSPLQATAETPQPSDLLTKIGRGAEKIPGDSWEALSTLWRKGSESFKDLAVKDRRYILWALSKYSQGFAPSSFVSLPKPAKKFRGWGARVQRGKRLK